MQFNAMDEGYLNGAGGDSGPSGSGQNQFSFGGGFGMFDFTSSSDWGVSGSGFSADISGFELPTITLGGGGVGGGGMARDRAVALVNSAETILQRNYQEYRDSRMSADETAARFDAVWTSLVQQLQALGSEGQRAIADRQQGGKYDWFSYYRPGGVPITAGTPSTGTGGFNQQDQRAGILPSVDNKTVLIILFAGFLAWVMFGKN